MAWDREQEQKHGKAMTIGSSIFGLIFAIFWCITAASMGAWFMLIFGIPFVGMMIHRIYVLVQMTKKDETQAQNRQADPWDRPAEAPKAQSGGNFCPYCGSAIQEGFAFCPKCGRRLS